MARAIDLWQYRSFVRGRECRCGGDGGGERSRGGAISCVEIWRRCVGMDRGPRRFASLHGNTAGRVVHSMCSPVFPPFIVKQLLVSHTYKHGFNASLPSSTGLPPNDQMTVVESHSREVDCVPFITVAAPGGVDIVCCGYGCGSSDCAGQMVSEEVKGA